MNHVLVTLEQKYGYMSVTFSTIPRGILTRETDRLSVAISTKAPLSNFLRDARAFFRASPGTSESERITIAQKALVNRSELVGAFIDYFKANPHVQTFEGLAVELVRHEHLYLQLMSAGASLSVIHTEDVPAPDLSATAVGRRSTTPSAYCWSHGFDHHSSASCKNGFKNHKTAATKDSKMGGFTHTWGSLSAEQKAAVKAKANA